jgi:hypothetical protein
MPIPRIPLPSGSVTTRRSQMDPKPSSKDFVYNQLPFFFLENFHWAFFASSYKRKHVSFDTA